MSDRYSRIYPQARISQVSDIDGIVCTVRPVREKTVRDTSHLVALVPVAVASRLRPHTRPMPYWSLESALTRTS